MHDTLLDTTVDLTVHPSADSKMPSSPVHATHEQSENKLLQTAEVNFPAEGDWTLSISVQRNSDHADFSLPLQVVKGETGMGLHWPHFIVLSFAAVLAFVYLRRHHARKIRGLERPVSIL